MRSTRETVEWYRSHETTAQLGYNPNGMCLKICREARGIGALYPSAKAAQDATPRDHRVYDVADIRRGMVVYYDDPRDSNRFGHIVTVVGRVQGADPSSLESLLVRTNSVVSGRVVVVRGDYFPRYWGDPFQFAATWLNGQALEMDAPKPVKPPKPEPVKPTGPQTRGPAIDRMLKDGRAAAQHGSKQRRSTIRKALELLRSLGKRPKQ